MLERKQEGREGKEGREKRREGRNQGGVGKRECKLKIHLLPLTKQQYTCLKTNLLANPTHVEFMKLLYHLAFNIIIYKN